MSTAIQTQTRPPGPSSAYVPRSRPSSPSIPPPSAHSPGFPSAPTPTIGSPRPPAGSPYTSWLDKRANSNLRHELRDSSRVSDKALSEGAKTILRILSALPAPLSGSLPPIFTPAKHKTSNAKGSFTEYARTTKRRSESSSSDEQQPMGLGLHFKKRKASSISPTGTLKTLPSLPSSPALLGRSLTPQESPRAGRPAHTRGYSLSHAASSRSGLRNEIGDMGSWTHKQFADAANHYRTRALLLKRHGDAYDRSASAQPKYTAILPQDHVRAMLCLTDAVLLWLFSYWCDEQHGTRIRGTPYSESLPLRQFVLGLWESDMRKADNDEARERAKAMVGLLHLVEAVVNYHLNTEQLAQINRRAKDLSSNSGPSPLASAGSPTTGPSPTAASAHSQASGSPESQSSTVHDLLPFLTTSHTHTHRSQHHLLASRHHLSLGILRTRFPETFEHAIHSELAEESLPAPGDPLGSAKKLDIDEPERFAWPIELGMQCPVAHTAVFGRSLVSEYGRAIGGWDVRLEA